MLHSQTPAMFKKESPRHRSPMLSILWNPSIHPQNGLSVDHRSAGANWRAWIFHIPMDQQVPPWIHREFEKSHPGVGVGKVESMFLVIGCGFGILEGDTKECVCIVCVLFNEISYSLSWYCLFIYGKAKGKFHTLPEGAGIGPCVLDRVSACPSVLSKPFLVNPSPPSVLQNPSHHHRWSEHDGRWSYPESFPLLDWTYLCLFVSENQPVPLWTQFLRHLCPIFRESSFWNTSK